MIRKNWLGTCSRVASVVVALFITIAILGNEIHAQSAQSIANGAVLKPTSPPAFVVAPSLPLGDSPTSIAAGVLTSSGRIDLVTADSSAGRITLFTGLGSGSFATGRSYSAGAQPSSLVLGDVDGDGRPDVLLANPSEGVISVFPGNGDGTLGARKTYAIGFAPSLIAIGGFTGNRKADVAVAGAASKTFAILENDGTGNLNRPVNFALASTPTAITTADFNNDGRTDLAFANSNGTLTVLLGKGNGQFSALADTSVSTTAFASITVDDLNRDGNADLVLTLPAMNQAIVLLGKGDGTFGPPAFFPVGDTPVVTHVADVDSDGIPDLIVINKGSNTFSVLNGVGGGSFKSAAHFVVGNAPLGVVVADLYGHGHVDLATINQLGHTLSVPAGNGDGTFAAGRAYTAGVQPVTVAAGDLTRSGKSDLVVGSYCINDATCDGSGSAAVLLAGPGGIYQLSSTYAMGTGSISMRLIDVNADGKPDIVALNRVDKSVSIRLGAGDGTFGDLITLQLSGAPVALANADFNKDGNTDLVVLTDCGATSCSQPGEVEFLPGAGDGSFRSVSTYAVGYAPVGLVVGKTSASGNIDVVIANRCGVDASCKSAGTATVLLGDGTGAFKIGTDVALGNSPSSIALADMRGAGVPDLIVSRSSDNTIAVLPGTGKGTFGAAVPYVVGHAPGKVVVADFNGDGQPDVAVANTADATVSVLFGQKGGVLQPAFAVPVSGNPSALEAINGPTASSPASLATTNGSTSMPRAATNLTVISNLAPRPMAGAGGGTTASTTVLSSGTNPSTVNHGVLLTATVTGVAGSGNPTGNVVFNSDGTGISDCGGSTGLAVTAGPGVTSTVSCTTSALTAGATGHSLTGQYLGDTHYDVSTSAAVTQVVNKASTTLTIIAPAASAVNTSVTFTATLHGTFAPIAPTTGSTTTSTVAFFADGSLTPISGCGAIQITGSAGVYTAACSTDSLDATAHSISATYSGDTNFSGSSTTASASYTPTKANTTITVAAPAPSAVNTSVTFTATLHGTFAPNAPTTGSTTVSTVALYADGSATAISGCDAAQLTGNAGVYTATCSTNSLDGTAHSISATYSGDTNFATSSTTASASYTPTKATTTLTVAAPGTPSAVNTSITFTATLHGTFTPVAPTTGSPTTSTVAFFADGSPTPISGCTAVQLTVAASIYTAACTTNSLHAGAHQISATYAGDSGFATSSTTASASYTVNKGDVTLAVSGPTVASPVNTIVTVTGTLTGTFTPVAPGGTIAFVANASTNAINLCTSTVGPLTAPGSFGATCQTQALISPNDVISATYAGNTDFNARNQSTNATVPVSKDTPTTAIVLPAQAPVTNQPFTISAQVSDPNGTAVNPSGTVTFSVNSSAVCSNAGLSSAIPPTATCAYNAGYTAGTPVSTSYAGDTNFNSSAKSETLVVNTATTQTAVSTPGQSQVNQAVTVSTTVTPQYTGKVVPQGTVTFSTTGSVSASDTCATGVTLHADGTVPNCTYTFLTASTAGTPFTITATYHTTAGDLNFSTSNSSTTQIVNPANAALALATTVPNATATSFVNQKVTFDATFTATFSGTPPSGTMTYTDQSTTPATTMCSKTVTNGVIPTCDWVFTVAGPHQIKATFSNDPNFNPGSATITQTVKQGTSTTVLDSSLKPSSKVNQIVTFTATVTPTDQGTQTSTGTVTFTATPPGSSTATILCPSVAVTNGLDPTRTFEIFTARCQLFNSPGVGAYTISATFSGDVNFSVGAPTAYTQQVAPDTIKSVALTSGVTSSAVNQQTTFTATITPNDTGGVAPGGTVTFTDSDGTTLLCPPAVVSANPGGQGTSSGTCLITFLKTGTHTVMATYSGDTNFDKTGAAGDLAGWTVTKAGTVTQTMSTPNPSFAYPSPTGAAAVTFTAVVTPAGTKGASLSIPTGTVQFTSKTTSITLPATCASVALNPSPANDGTAIATCPVVFTHIATAPPGQVTVTGSYMADANFAASSGDGVQTVQDFNAGLSITPASTTGNISSNKNGVYLTQGYSTTLTAGTQTNYAVFEAATITAPITTSAGYNPTMTANCQIFAGTDTTQAPLTDPACTPATASQSVKVSGNAAAPAFEIAASQKAPTGTFTVVLTVADPNFTTGVQTQTFPLYVIAPVTTTLNVTIGSSATQNVSFDTTSTSLTFSCPFLWSVDQQKMLDNTKGNLLTCMLSSGTSIQVTGGLAQAGITFTPVVKAAGNARPSSTLYAASLLSIPFLAVLTWFGSRKSERRNLFRFLELIVLLVGLSFLTACGGGFTTTLQNPTPTGELSGNYLVQVQAQDGAGNSFYAVLPMQVLKP